MVKKGLSEERLNKILAGKTPLSTSIWKKRGNNLVLEKGRADNKVFSGGPGRGGRSL